MQEAGFESLLLTVCVTLDKSPQPLKLNKKELPILDLQRSGQSHTHLCAQHACHNIQHIFITQQIFIDHLVSIRPCIAVGISNSV